MWLNFKIKLLKLLLNNIFEYKWYECRHKWIESVQDDIYHLLNEPKIN